MDVLRIGRVRIVLDAEQELRRYQHGFNGQLDALLGGFAARPGQRHELQQRRHFRARRRPPVGAVRQRGDDLIHARLPGFRIANQNLLPAGALDIRGEWSLKDDRIQILVLLAVVRIFLGQCFDEVVVDETRAEDVVAGGQVQAHLGFRVRIEINQFRRLGFDGHRLHQACRPSRSPASPAWSPRCARPASRSG